MKMPTFNRKVRISLDWALSVVFPPDLVEVRTETENGTCKQHFKAGEVVFFQGDVGEKVYIIGSGGCEVLQQGEGAQSVVAKLGAGDYFGEMAVLV